MKIGISTWGSNGDIRPFIALAAGLGASGHEVRLHITSVESRDYSRFASLPGVSLSQLNVPEPSIDIRPELERRVLSERNPVKQLKYVIDHLFTPVEDGILQAAKALCRDCDLVIGHVISYPLDIAARQTDTPRVCVSLSPFLPSGHISPLGNISLGVTGNNLLWKLVKFGVNRILVGQVNRMRQREGLPPIRDFFADVALSPFLNLLAVSPTLIPPPPDWPQHCKVTGFFNIPERSEPWEMPADLKAFFEAGEKPVFVSFGSMMDVSVEHRETTSAILEAVQRAGCRAIVQSRWEDLPDLPEHPDVFRIGSAPHKYLFPHCALIVHHGGAGTTQSALLSGCPQLFIPHGMDQEYWAGRLKALGVSAGTLHRRRLRADRLAPLLRHGLDCTMLRANALALAEQMRREDGVATAIEAILVAGLKPA